MLVSMSSSSTLQARHKMLSAANQLQVRARKTHGPRRSHRHRASADSHIEVCVCVCVDRLVPQSLLGTHNLGRVHYEPVKDRHGNVLLVTVREVESQHSLLSGKWMLVTKLQSQRKSLSTPEEPYALDILIITLQVRRLR